ncbi:protein CWC15 homolog [Neodiprion pinetum]|uniref:Protein CWC15 homolog n=1 Tax=Neodiprion lecontei TaxID=441921 RepID=A0A6J0BRQ3_NEOLC|nr:protein CWC15 homolog [Neodiprion lecontei]XP_046414609.1 protein CWC15 homolog [Neodiprion fabricii]XP_046470390.1 protein CWC15 homolog [Neodiprion pinetum]XP_046607981.1 protein CWC15 homolog [Neodiprion virginianus]
MTTAARPTFEPARGGQGRGEKDLSAISKQYSSRDLPSHTKLKYREYGQGTTDELRSRDFRKELDEREREKEKASNRRMIEPANRDGSAVAAKRQKIDQVPAASLDADDPLDEDDSDSDSDEDDTVALLAELQRIKKERAADQAKKEIEKRQEEERIRMENILSGNPLLNYSAQPGRTDMKVRRRWDDDVVFKNCARSEPEKKRDVFINDSLRSEFHRKFMEKYVK